MKIQQLIKRIASGGKNSNLEDFPVRGISCNSKNVKEDFVFVAIKGNRQDGNQFIEEAIQRGARVVVIGGTGYRVQGTGKITFITVKDTRKALAELAAEFYGHPSRKIKVVGITGTNGKTTISYLIEAILKKAKYNPAVIGTINYRFKDKATPSKNTTPGSIELQLLLNQMLKEEINYCLMEVSSHALDQHRVGGISFHSAIFTNLTQDHLDYHKTLKNYFESKSLLFRNLSHRAFAIINNDDQYALRLKKVTKAEIITYGIEQKADIMARDIKFNPKYTTFRLLSWLGECEVKSRLIGRHNVYNLLAASAWALKEGISLVILKDALEEFSFVPGRLERINSKGKFSVFVDYAHTEAALRNVIQTLKYLPHKRLLVLFGCGGERDRAKRPKMGQVVSELADYAIITSDNPRSEDPQDIIRGILKGIRKKNFCVVPERRAAIRKALSWVRPEDILLVAGKGHEQDQVLKDKTVPFDDREVIRACLRQKNS